MTRKIANLKRRLSKTARQAMATSGRKNLAAWRKQSGKALPDVEGDAARFRADLQRELGVEITATQRALLLCAESAYIAISLAKLKLLRTRRLRRLESAFDRLARLQSSLLRILRALRVGQEPSETGWEDELARIGEEIAAKRTSAETNNGATQKDS